MKFVPGNKVYVTFGLDGEVVAEVIESYGPPARRHVLVRLTPDVSGDLVAEPVELSVPEDAVRSAQPAA